METWKPVTGYEEIYEVSSEGRLRRVKGGRGATPGRVLKPSLMNAGYLIYQLWEGNKQTARLAHRLVAETFLGPCPVGYEVHHLDGDKENNRVENLMYVTRSENLYHRVEQGIGRGDRNGRSKLTEEDVLTIRRRHAAGDGYKRIAASYGVTWEAVRNIVKGRTWKWLQEPDCGEQRG